MDKINNSKNDKRIQKTKTAIMTALGTLLTEKPIDKITVTEVANLAGINRKTFYCHYNSVSDVVEEIENYSVESFLILLSELKNFHNKIYSDETLVKLNSLINNYNFYYKSVLCIENNYTLLHKYTITLKKTIEEKIISNSPTLNIEEKFVPLVASFVAGAIINTYHDWLINRSDIITIDELAEFMHLLLSPGLEAIVNL